MSQVDEHGNAHSTESGDAIASWERAIDACMTFNEDPTAAIDAALEADADLVMGQAFKAAGMLMGCNARDRKKLLERVATLNKPAPRANDRERGHIAALNARAAGDWIGAGDCYGGVLPSFPRDAYALRAAHYPDFYRGDSTRMRDRIARVLPLRDAQTPGYSFVSGVHAFTMEEDGDDPRAEERGLHARDLDNRDACAVHAVVHVCGMEGRRDDGIAWMDETWDHWKDAVLAVHNAWHASLYHVERGDYARALDIHDIMLFRPEDNHVSEVHDCAALLWHLTLFGVDVSARWTEHLPLWQARTGDASLAFNDMHCMMGLAATGDDDGQSELLKTMESTAGGETTKAGMTRLIGLPVCRGIPRRPRIDLMAQRQARHRPGRSRHPDDSPSATAPAPSAAATRSATSSSSRCSNRPSRRATHRPPACSPQSGSPANRQARSIRPAWRASDREPSRSLVSATAGRGTGRGLQISRISRARNSRLGNAAGIDPSDLVLLVNGESGHMHPRIFGSRNEDIRADMMFFETPDGGAVACVSAMPCNGFASTIAQLARNVVDRFRDPAPFPEGQP